MMLRHMRDLVREHRSHFAFALGGVHQADIQADEAAGCSERVDLIRSHDEEGEFLLRTFAERDQAIAEGVHVVVDQCIFQHQVDAAISYSMRAP
jgi:hypothetical protein